MSGENSSYNEAAENNENELEYLDYAGNRFLIDRGVLKDVQVETEVVRIPEEVKEIRRQAFLDARLLGKMEVLVIPASVRKMERLAFAGMPHLKKVELLAGIATLEQGVFRNCMELESILMPNTLRKIESRAFENCLQLKEVTLPQVWVQISEDAFLNCVGLKNKRIEKAMEEAAEKRREEEAEARRARFPHLYNSEEKEGQAATEAVSEQQEESQAEPEKQPELSLDKQQENQPVTEKPQKSDWLHKLRQLQKQMLEFTEKPAEKPRQEGLSAAEELLEAQLAAEQAAFQPFLLRQPVQEPPAVEQPAPELPQQLETSEANFCIHEGVLERCETSSSRISIPEGVTALGPRVFYGMSQLEEIRFPSTLTYIGAEALEGTAWLENERKKDSYVVVNGILVSAFYNSMIMEAKLPDTIVRIAPYAFYHSEAQLVTLPESVQEIDAYAFVECGVTEIDFSAREDVVLHNPVASQCENLKELYFQGKLDRLEEGVVEECPALKRVCLKWKQTVVHNQAFPENVRIWVL